MSVAEDNPLALFTMEELVDEIKSRHSAILLATLQDHKTDNGSTVVNRWFSGSRITALGLAEVMRTFLSSAFVDHDPDDTTDLA